jgi:hypothetical protein
MFAIRCKGQMRGFRCCGTFFHFNRWILVDAPTEEQLQEPMLEVKVVSGSDDPALAPFPVEDADVQPPTVEELQAQIDGLREHIEALKSAPAGKTPPEEAQSASAADRADKKRPAT